jgi:hypothetical protein
VICRIQKLLMIASLVMGCVAFAARADAQVDAATAQRARALIAAIQQSTAPIMDLTCTVQLTWSGVMWGGGEGREYLENRIRMFEIFKQRELLADARADKQIKDLKAVLNAPKAADSVVVTRWRTRRDGLFRMLRANSKADGTWSIYDHAFDGEQARAYVWESKQGVILKYTPGFSDPSPDFAWRVGAERLEAFIARALREGDVQISDAVAGDERYIKGHRAGTTLLRPKHHTGVCQGVARSQEGFAADNY